MLLTYYVLMCLVFGTTFLGIKLGVEAGGPPFLFAALRFFLAGVLLLGFLFLRKKKFPSDLRIYVSLFWISICNTTVLFGVLYWAEQYLSSNLAALLNAVSPVMISLLGAIQQRRGLHVTQVGGLLLGIFGLYLVVGSGSQGAHPVVWWYAVAVLTVAQIANAVGSLKSRRIMVEGLSPWFVNGFQMVFGSVGLFVASLVQHERISAIVHPAEAFGSLAFLVFIGSILGWGLYYFLVGHINPLLPSTWCYVSPIVAMVVGNVILHEKVGFLSVIGAVIVLLGVGICNWMDWKLLWKKSDSRKSVHLSEKVPN